MGERIIGDVHRVLSAEHSNLRSLRDVFILAYATTGRRDDAMALAARYPIADEEEAKKYTTGRRGKQYFARRVAPAGLACCRVPNALRRSRPLRGRPLIGMSDALPLEDP